MAYIEVNRDNAGDAGASGRLIDNVIAVKSDVDNAYLLQNQINFAPLLSQFSKSRVVRILYTGTSIENNSTSAFRVWFEALKDYFGDSGNFSQILAKLGGNFTDPYLGWDKQPFSGLSKHRIRGNSSSTPLKLAEGSVKKIVLSYSTESDGGSFDLYVDGVFNQTIDCSGSQSFGNEIVLEWDELGFHAIEIKAPASDYAYVECVHWCQDNNGIHVIDGSYGGSMIQNYVSTAAATGNQVEPIPVVGDNGLDAVFNNQSEHTKPDLTILPYIVNDAGRGEAQVNSLSIPSINKVVQYTKDNGSHLMTCCEMGGHYTMQADANHVSFNLMRDAMASSKNESFVTYVDWHLITGLLDATEDDDRLEELAFRYYEVTAVDISAGTYTGDFIHPNGLGYSTLGDYLCMLSGVFTVVAQDTSITETLGSVTAGGSISNNARLNHETYAKDKSFSVKQANQVGIENIYTITSESKGLVSKTQEPCYFSDSEFDYADTAYNEDINNSLDADEYGKYVDFTSEYKYIDLPFLDATKQVTITIIVGSGVGNIRVNNYDNSSVMPVVVAGESNIDSLATLSSGYKFENITNKPKIHHITINCTDTRVFTTIKGKVYKVYMTPTSFACIPSKNISESKYPFTNAIPDEDMNFSTSVDGQVYIDSDDSEKLCVSIPVLNPITGNIESLHRAINYTDSARELITLKGTLTDQGFNNKLGSKLFSTTQSPVIYEQSSRVGDALAERDTCIVINSIDNTPSYSVYLLNGSNNDILALNDDGTWTAELISNLPKFVSSISSRGGMPMVLKFKYPTIAQLDGYQYWTPIVKWSEGSVSSYPKYIVTASGKLPTM